METVWTCKIGVPDDIKAMLPRGADLPMRQAVQRAFAELTGIDAEFCFSGWGGQLDEGERQIAERFSRR